MEAHLAPKQPVQVNKITSHVRSVVVPMTVSTAWEISSKLLSNMRPRTPTKLEASGTLANQSKTISVTPAIRHGKFTQTLGLVSNFMASHDARFSKFEANFKKQQSEMTNKIDTVLKAITNRISRALPSDMVKNPKLNVNSTSLVLSARSYPMEDPQSTHRKTKTLKRLLHYPVRIVRDVEVHIGRLKLLNGFYIIDIKKDPETPLLVGRGFLATANAVRDCRKAKIAVGEGVTRSIFDVKGIELGEEEAPYRTTLEKRESYKLRPSSDGMGSRTTYYAKKEFMDCHLPNEWEIARDAEINPFKDVLVFRRMVEFLGDIPINLKRNMWELKDGEEFTKTLQSVPPLENFLKGKVQGRSSTWTTSMTPFGWHLEEIHVTWAQLEKKRTRLRLYTNYFKEKHTVRGDGVANYKRWRQSYQVMASWNSRRRQNEADLKTLEDHCGRTAIQTDSNKAAKFVRDFKSLTKEADESLAKHKALELEIERLLRLVVSQDSMSIMQSNSIVDTSNLQT
ncbi:hypothetical protein Tco_0403614 [Tanacetum coccineum]